MKKVFLSGILMMLFYYGFSEDVIIRTNGKRMNCTITSVDSINVYFTIIKNENQIQTFIKKSDVQNIIYNNDGSTNENKKEVETLVYNKNRLAFSFGLSLPFSDYENSDVDDEKAGLAGIGLNFNFINYTYKVTPYFGIGTKLFYNTNYFKSEKLKDELQSQTGYDWSYKKVHYSSLGFMAGLVGFIPNNRVTLEFRFLVGPMSLNTPEVKLTIDQYDYWMKITKSSSNAFCFNPGFGIDYVVSDNLSLLLNVDYIKGKFKFDDVITVDSYGYIDVYEGGKQNFDVINISIGFGYNFNIK